MMRFYSVTVAFNCLLQLLLNVFSTNVRAQIIRGNEVISVPKTTQMVFINGILSEWDSAAVLEFKCTIHYCADIPSETIARIMWDDTKLYIALEVHTSLIEASQIEGYENVWLDNGIEIFIDSKHNAHLFNPYSISIEEFVKRGGQYLPGYPLEYLQEDDYHFIINAINTVETLQGKDLKPYNHIKADIFSSTNYSIDSLGNKNGYVVEVAIPWNTLHVTVKRDLALGFEIAVNLIDSLGKRTPFSYSGNRPFRQPYLWNDLKLIDKQVATIAQAKWDIKEYIFIILLAFFFSISLLFFKRKISQRAEAYQIEKSKPQQNITLHKQVQEIIANNYYKNSFTSTDTASQLNMSLRNLQHILNKETSKTFTELLNEYRLEQAKNLLETTNETTQTICYQVGFTTPSYFSKLFKGKYLKSPTAYRKSLIPTS